MATCEMIDALGDQDVACEGVAVGRTEDGVLVCEPCAAQMRAEGFRVDPLPPEAA